MPGCMCKQDPERMTPCSPLTTFGGSGLTCSHQPVSEGRLVSELLEVPPAHLPTDLLHHLDLLDLLACTTTKAMLCAPTAVWCWGSVLME